MKKIFTKNKIITILLLTFFLFLLNLNLKQNNHKNSIHINNTTITDSDSILKSMHEIDSIINEVHFKNEEKDNQILNLKNKNKDIKIISNNNNNNNNNKEEFNYDFEPIFLKSERKETYINLIIINDTIINKIYIYDTIQKIQIDTIVYKKEDIKKIKFRKN